MRFQGTRNVNGREVSNYNGVNMQTGQILKIRNLDKIGKDGSGTYLYAGYIQTTSSEDKAEVLGAGRPLGNYVCFEMRQRLEDIVRSDNKEQIRNILELLSYGKMQKSLSYLGKIDERGIITRDSNSDSLVIRNTIEELKRQYEQEMNMQETIDG